MLDYRRDDQFYLARAIDSLPVLLILSYARESESIKVEDLVIKPASVSVVEIEHLEKLV